MKKIFLLLLVGLLLISSASAFWYDNSFNLDSKRINDKSLDLGKETTTKYGEYIIEKSEWYDPLKIWTKSEILRIDLKNNTDYCTDCFGQGSVTIQEDAKIFKQPSWKRSFDDGENWIDWEGFTNWKLMIENKNRFEEREILEPYEVCGESKQNHSLSDKMNTSWNVQACEIEYRGTGKYETIDTGEFIVFHHVQELL